MMMTHCYSQSSILQTNDSWVYVNNSGEIRYDLPKFRVQKLENLSKKYLKLNNLYLNSQVLVDQVVGVNLSLQNELLSIQPKLNELNKRNTNLVQTHNRLITMYNTVLTKNNNLELKLKESKTKAKRYKSQRNWAVAGVAILVTSAIISLK